MLNPEVAGDGGQASANHHAETHFLCQIASSMFPDPMMMPNSTSSTTKPRRCAGEPGNQSQNFFEFKAAAKKKNSADVFALCTDIGKDHDISTCLNSDGMRSWRLKLASILVAHVAQLGFVQGALCYPFAECIYSPYIVSEPCF